MKRRSFLVCGEKRVREIETEMPRDKDMGRQKRQAGREKRQAGIKNNKNAEKAYSKKERQTYRQTKRKGGTSKSI